MKNLKYFVFMFISFFVSLSGVYAEAICAYELQPDFKVTCTASNNSVSCVNNSNGDIKFNYSSISLSYNDFVSNSSFKCPSNIYLELFQDRENGSNVIEIRNISSTKGANMVGLNNTDSKITESPITTTTNPTENKEYENDPEYIAAKAEADLYCGGINNPNQNITKCDEAQKKMRNIMEEYADYSTGDGTLDLENPCQGAVLGVFTTIGWVFFIIKIGVPILLIIFGTIDVSKAIVSSKDDEIKKSVKTLVLRAIAGVIIFFIPTILNFIVEVVGDRATGVYNNNFSKCTSCIFKPNKSYCTTLGGK